jgi:hypothetical protein
LRTRGHTDSPGRRPPLTTSVPTAPLAPLAHPAPPPHRSRWPIGRHRSCPMALRLRTTPAHAACTGHPTRPAHAARPARTTRPSGHQRVPPHAPPHAPSRTRRPPRARLPTRRPPRARPPRARPQRPPGRGPPSSGWSTQRHHRRNRFSLSPSHRPPYVQRPTVRSELGACRGCFAFVAV